MIQLSIDEGSEKQLFECSIFDFVYFYGVVL
jgi:hypothetical protein